MKVIIEKDYQELSKTASQMLLGEMYKRHERVNLAITGGTTPVGAYEKLIPEVKGKPQFSHVHYYNFDEIPFRSEKEEGITIRDLRNLYFDPAKIQEEQIHKLDGSNYEKQDQAIFDAGGLDAILLGVGADGHYCGNLPQTTQFTDFTSKVLCDERIKKRIGRLYDDPNEVPDYYITMGPRSIMSARHLILIASGKKKAEIIRDLVHGEIDADKPVTLLKTHPHLTVVVDEEAGELLEAGGIY